MKLVITGGGTGGHTMPAVGVALAAQRAGAEVLYIGSERGIERAVAEENRLAFEALEVYPIGKPFTPSGIRSLAAFARAVRRAGALLHSCGADVVFGTGGYASAAVLAAQGRRRGPVVLHEQNTIPGRVNRRIARRASAVCLTFDESAAFFRGHRTVMTGLPLRMEATHSHLSQPAARERFGLDPQKFTVVAIGGSQGALGINETVLATVQRLPFADVQWLHVCGERHADTMRQCADRIGLNGNYRIWSFLHGDEVAAAYRAADMMVCRAGAATLVETAYWGLPCVFVPYPHAFADHQRHNAEYLTKRGAGELIAQALLSPERLSCAIESWRSDEAARREVGQRARSLFTYDAVVRILGVIEDVSHMTFSRPIVGSEVIGDAGGAAVSSEAVGGTSG